MNKKFIIYTIGILLEVLSFILLIPAAIAYFEAPSRAFFDALRYPSFFGFTIATISTFLFGKILKIICFNNMV